MEADRAGRKLTAILAADVAGYSRPIGADDEGTLASLTLHRRELIDPSIAKHRGRMIKTTGDGLLAEFASVVDAVRCAVEVQEGMVGRNANVSPDKRLDFRIGINFGDVVEQDGDIFGDGVNIAARLEGMAEPGGICVSERVQEDAAGKISSAFEDIGEHALRNIARPIRVYRLRPEGEVTATSQVRPALSLPNKPSIVVLPFQNMSGDPEQEYFADGVVEDIINALAHFHHLFVIARNSSFTYKGRPVDVRQVGRELGVRYVVEGSVRRAGDRLRITAQLIDASTSAHLWADRFEGLLTDVFDLQDQVAASVVGSITPRVEAAEIELAKRKPTESLDAYDYYLRGLAILNRTISKEATVEALRLFNEAIARDREFALAHAMAARCYTFRRINGWMVDRATEVAEAARLARRAVDLGRDDGLALSYGGFALGFVAGDLDDGAACIDRALLLNPNLAAAWGFSSWVKICFGEHDAAIRHAAVAMRLSPLDPRMFTWQFFTGLAHLSAGRYDDAVSWAERTLRDQPNYASGMRVAAAGHALAARPAEAQQIIARLCRFDPALRLSNLADVLPPFRRPEDRARYVEGLRAAGLPE